MSESVLPMFSSRSFIVSDKRNFIWNTFRVNIRLNTNTREHIYCMFSQTCCSFLLWGSSWCCSRGWLLVISQVSFSMSLTWRGLARPASLISPLLLYFHRSCCFSFIQFITSLHVFIVFIHLILSILPDCRIPMGKDLICFAHFCIPAT